MSARWHLMGEEGGVRLEFVPADVWLGLYVGDPKPCGCRSIFVCVIPMLPLVWPRRCPHHRSLARQFVDIGAFVAEGRRRAAMREAELELLTGYRRAELGYRVDEAERLEDGSLHPPRHPALSVAGARRRRGGGVNSDLWRSIDPLGALELDLPRELAREQDHRRRGAAECLAENHHRHGPATIAWFDGLSGRWTCVASRVCERCGVTGFVRQSITLPLSIPFAPDDFNARSEKLAAELRAEVEARLLVSAERLDQVALPDY